MAKIQISARLDESRLKQAQKALRAKTISETLERALELVTEKAVHDQIIRKYSGVGASDAFEKD